MAVEPARGVRPDEAQRPGGAVPVELVDLVGPEATPIDHDELARHACAGEGHLGTACGDESLVVKHLGGDNGDRGDDEEGADRDGQEGQATRATRAPGGGRWGSGKGRSGFGNPAGSIPERHSIVAPFDDPAD